MGYCCPSNARPKDIDAKESTLAPNRDEVLDEGITKSHANFEEELEAEFLRSTATIVSPLDIVNVLHTAHPAAGVQQRGSFRV